MKAGETGTQHYYYMFTLRHTFPSPPHVVLTDDAFQFTVRTCQSDDLFAGDQVPPPN